MMTIMDEKSMI